MKKAVAVSIAFRLAGIAESKDDFFTILQSLRNLQQEVPVLFEEDETEFTRRQIFENKILGIIKDLEAQEKGLRELQLAEARKAATWNKLMKYFCCFKPGGLENEC